MRRIDSCERRARLATRHHLAPAARTTDVVAVAGRLVGLHASDPLTVYLAARARADPLEVADLERALYDERSLLRIVGMRRTMFVVPRDVAAVIDAACTKPIGELERRRLVGWLASTGVVDDAEPWLAGVEAATMAALERRGQATAAELTRDVPRLSTQIPFGEGKTWQGTVGVSTRVLFLLAAQGRIVRGRPKGTISSSLYRWAPMQTWLGESLEPWDVEDARVELARRWLATFGPGTVADLRWWTGWNLGDTRRALAAIDPVEIELEGGTAALVLPGDLAAAPRPEPWAALLPSLDPSVMGWQERGWFLGPHGPRLFDRNGNAGPTAWWDGRVVGGWAQRADGDVVVHLLEDVGSDAREALHAEAEAVRQWLGAVRVIPRFRTPLETELTS